MKFSVVVPAYNAERYIGECLLSVVRQTKKPYEIVVVDDGSTDKTAEIVEDFNIKLVSHRRNLGIGAARQTGASKTKGDYVCFLSADDCYHPLYLELVNRLADGKCGVFTNYWRCDCNLIPQQSFMIPLYVGETSFREQFIDYALHQNMFVNFSTVAIPKDIFEKVQFDRNLRYGEDLVFLIESLLNGLRWVHTELPLVYYRVHGDAGTVKGWNPERRFAMWSRLVPLLRKLNVSEERIRAAYDGSGVVERKREMKRRLAPLVGLYRFTRKKLM